MPQVNRNQDSKGNQSGSGLSLDGAAYFRGLEQLGAGVPADSSAEFPSYDPKEMVTGGKASRRSFMKLAGASMALAGVTLTGCRRWPKEQIVPYSAGSRDRIPGVPEHYATTFELGGIAEGLVVTTYDGRPIKVEGNPDHPMNVAFGGLAGKPAGQPNGRYGAAGMFAQASVLEMYDPERSRSVREGKEAGAKGAIGTPSTYVAFVEGARRALGAGGVAFLSTATSSPSVRAQWAKVAAAFPGVSWYEYEPLSDDNEREGARLAFGKPVRPLLDLKTADVVVSLDADLLGKHPVQVRYSADWAERRRQADPKLGGNGTMSRVLVAESIYSNTGAAADERIGVKVSQVDAIARAIAAGLGVAGASEGALSPAEKAFVEHAVSSIKSAGAKAVVAAGGHLAPETHAVAFAINAAIKSSVVKYLDLPDTDRPTHLAAITKLAAEINSGAVKGLVVLGGNPVYDAPADLKFKDLLGKVAFSAYHGLYENETSRLCGWHVPEAHYLESWGDARAYDGTVSLLQPMIEPMFGGKSKAELLAALAGGGEVAGKEVTGKEISLAALGSAGGNLPTAAYQTALQKGVVEGSGYAVATVTARALPAAPAAVGGAGGGDELEVRFVSSNLYDGRFANLGWLIELPDPMTKLTWDNALILSKKDADARGLTTGSKAAVTVGGETLEMAVYVLPGQPVGVAQLPLGWGRKAAGTIGNATGFDTYELRTTGGFQVAAAKVVKTAGTYDLASTQAHYIADWSAPFGYDPRIGAPNESGKIIRESTFAQFKESPKYMHRKVHGDLSLQLWDPPHPLTQAHAWGMAIDMSACTGCGACVVACQAENNIPTVGKHQVLMQRAMHWIRIDRYFKSDRVNDPDLVSPQVVFQPMMCVHCENAPCEQVCPVAATVHDTEGLNTMVYNRCIGTRYCSNNCPYKVRRFNYFDYHATSPRDGLRKPWPKIPDQQQREGVDPVKAMVYNPDVTVRMRGVMEKCTYCTQRIQNAKITVRNEYQQGKRESDKVPDGMVMTACQQACPTQAIWFGDLNDKGSRVTQWHASDRRYDVLAELNTRPRTKYLGKLRNPAVEPVKVAKAEAGAEAKH